MQVEAIALRMALSHALHEHRMDVVIHTDCLSLIHAVQQTEPRDNVYLLTSILHQLQRIHAEGRRVILNWVPGHIGVKGNEAADRAARTAVTKQAEESLAVFPTRAELEEKTRRAIHRAALRRHRTLATESDSARWYQRVTTTREVSLPRRRGSSVPVTSRIQMQV